MTLRFLVMLTALFVACGTSVTTDGGTGGGTGGAGATGGGGGAVVSSCDAGNGVSCAVGTGCGNPRSCPGTGGGGGSTGTLTTHLGYCDATGTVQSASYPFGYCPSTFASDGGAGCAMADGTTCPLGQACTGGACSTGHVTCWCEQSGGVPLCTGC
jgi:hypothetical protein